LRLRPKTLGADKGYFEKRVRMRQRGFGFGLSRMARKKIEELWDEERMVAQSEEIIDAGGNGSDMMDRATGAELAAPARNAKPASLVLRARPRPLESAP